MNGNWKVNEEDIEKIIAEYFAHIFKSTNPSEREIDEVLEHFEPRVTSEANQMLSMPFTADERLPSALNFTYIVLIPKVKKPEKMTEYRPISLCNVIYKFGSKAIANRLKPILCDIISPTQSAFVPKRLITDNVLVAYEINHFIKSNSSNRNNYMAVKLDISKAYDRIEWLFLRKILCRLGFLPGFVDLIMLCISSVSYSFLFNGSQFGSLRPSRGIRQGDPLSPYMFICCVEALITMVQKAVNEGNFHGIKIAPSAPTISNLCFADDTLLFCKASEADAITMKNILDQYARISGQEINFEKTNVSFCPTTSAALKESICNILGFQVVDRHEKYLGMPVSMGRTRKEIFSFLRDRIWARIKGWGEKQLSNSGKEVLIKAVLQAIPSYMMSCFMLPVGLINDLESAIRRFWWGNGNDRKMPWLAWNRMCMSKADGGLGFRYLRSFNIALLAKQTWRILNYPYLLLSKILKARYFSNGEVLTAELGSRPSATWRSLVKARSHLLKGLRKRIGDGSSTSIWADPWLGDDGNFKVITRRPLHSCFPDRVEDLIDQTSKSWDISIINEQFWPVDRERILAIPIGSSYASDKWIWHYTKDGKFTVKSCYQLALVTSHNYHANRGLANESSSGLSSRRWRNIWHLALPPKIRMFLWRACSDILPTQAELFRRKIATSPMCNHCGREWETPMHVFLRCRGMEKIWKSHPFGIIGQPKPVSMWDWIIQWQQQLTEDSFLLAVVVVWKAWESRNREMHGEQGMAMDEFISWGLTFLNLYQQAQLPRTPIQQRAHPTEWKPPREGIIKLNFDAALPAGTDHYTVAVIARDWQGHCIFWAARSFRGRPRAVDCEAHAALFALTRAKEESWPSIILEGDCLKVVEALRGEDAQSCSFGAYVEDCWWEKRLGFGERGRGCGESGDGDGDGMKKVWKLQPRRNVWKFLLVDKKKKKNPKPETREPETREISGIPHVWYKGNPKKCHPLLFERLIKASRLAIDVYNKTHPIKYRFVELSYATGVTIMVGLTITAEEINNGELCTFGALVNTLSNTVKSVKITPPSLPVTFDG
ncbi:PREDICTED: uncharacterized protein LOC105967016 [Erythranthe guttata]|uniref:uncharacterized protein LOC105967016 n=1 Tax=Erythranthe guttata TaxID=4155 RepID=UPI00064DE694|nr:PREDICTED: uncharacterized protein LOC105967016 [Erythranthe guttata]|eukprot:XP_012847034.1 PREDICTED: uncharacterized protein LOC105967016 [Erythranthe guttata]